MTRHLKVAKGGVITLPAAVCRELDLKEGDTVSFELVSEGTVSLKRHLKPAK
ncbi:AbrB/MazE/SpoVT family DNA-binding domain-containing protein [Sphingomonas sp. MG17]|uniref:AbrB/MazE/SpoVT family DNA-binding domain-containing protein n=1 Tax=Sphingomonas tagetis TaxID=2949092 RepID=A0A9X2HI50_9SPHN|nr:AbrB/MazE/SpoVT family DNA-binding domain-containing protein [Sphingomonas tagetis]MCP3730057.1 AbrB/MazE/SpoVT family DNA-binding domain-containing protein [Sphingomonas tagetis]